MRMELLLMFIILNIAVDSLDLFLALVEPLHNLNVSEFTRFRALVDFLS